MLRMKIASILAAFAVGITAISGCSGLSVKAGLASASSASVSQSETTVAATSAVAKETNKTEETSESSSSGKITPDTVKNKRSSLKINEYTCAIGTTYLGESENQAAMEVVLAEMGVDESLLKDPARLLDFGGSDLWMLCISDDVNILKVTVGEDENGKELFKAEKGNIPDYLFIRCFSSGEMSSCTVYAEGEVSGYTIYYPVMIGGQIVIPNGGGVLNQSEGYETYIDVDDPGETDNSDSTDNTEEEEP